MPIPSRDFYGDATGAVFSLDDFVCGDAPRATFFVRVEGDSFDDHGIHDGDVLVVDRARAPQAGDFVVAAVGAEMSVERIPVHDEPGDDAPPGDDLSAAETPSFTVWGVATHSLHRLR